MAQIAKRRHSSSLPKKICLKQHIVCAVCSLSSFEEGGRGEMCIYYVHALDIKLGTINQKGFFSTPSTPESFYEADVVE